MAVIQTVFNKYSDGSTEGYVSDLIYNYVDNKYATPSPKGKTAGDKEFRHPIPWGYAICHDDVDINTGNRPNTTQGQAVRLGAFRKPVAKIRTALTHNANHVIVKDWDYSYSVPIGGVIIVQSKDAPVTRHEMMIVTSMAAEGSGGDLRLNLIRNHGNSAPNWDTGNVEVDTGVFLLSGGPINFIGAAILDPRLPAVPNESACAGEQDSSGVSGQWNVARGHQRSNSGCSEPRRSGLGRDEGRGA